MSGVLNMYIMKIKRYSKGKNRCTRYKFASSFLGAVFAAGYQAALKDTNHTEYYVSVCKDNDELLYSHVDLEGLAGLAR